MLTERIIRDAKPGPKPILLWDRQVKGLACKVAVSGTKSYILNYRVAGREAGDAGAVQRDQPEGRTGARGCRAGGDSSGRDGPARTPPRGEGGADRQ